MENSKQCANGDALIHEAGPLQVLGQAHGHQLQQVGVPQLAAKEDSDEAEGRGWMKQMGAFHSSRPLESICTMFF